MSNKITALCDKIIELDKKCECIGLCYVQEHWFAEKEFKQYASDHAAKLARALKKSLLALEFVEKDMSIGTVEEELFLKQANAYLALKEIKEIFK